MRRRRHRPDRPSSPCVTSSHAVYCGVLMLKWLLTRQIRDARGDISPYRLVDPHLKPSEIVHLSMAAEVHSWHATQHRTSAILCVTNDRLLLVPHPSNKGAHSNEFSEGDAVISLSFSQVAAVVAIDNGETWMLGLPETSLPPPSDRIRIERLLSIGKWNSETLAQLRPLLTTTPPCKWVLYIGVLEPWTPRTRRAFTALASRVESSKP